MEAILDSLPPIRTSVKQPILIGSFILLIFVGGFGLWSFVADLSSGILALGTVKVDTHRKQIQHLEGGIVDEILVRDGDTVKINQTLVRLNKTRAGTSLALVRQSLDTALAQKARLLAEQNDEKLVFSNDFSVRQNPKMLQILRSQQQLFAARRASLQGQIAILDQQVVYLQEQIQGLDAQQLAKAAQVESIEGELLGLQKLLDKGMIGQTRVLELKRDKAELEGERGELLSQIAAARSSISEKELEKFQIRKNFKESVSSELKEVQTEIHDFTERLLAAEHVYEQTELKSPVDGVVVGSGVHTLGGVIAPGAVLMEIVPVNDRLVIEAAVIPKDIDNVQVGLEAGIQFSAFSQHEAPQILGKVTYIAADILENEKTGELYYKAKIEVDDDQIARLGQERKILPGMMADVIIFTGSRRPIDYLLEPLVVSFRKAWRET